MIISRGWHPLKDGGPEDAHQLETVCTNGRAEAWVYCTLSRGQQGKSTQVQQGAPLGGAAGAAVGPLWASDVCVRVCVFAHHASAQAPCRSFPTPTVLGPACFLPFCYSYDCFSAPASIPLKLLRRQTPHHHQPPFLLPLHHPPPPPGHPQPLRPLSHHAVCLRRQDRRSPAGCPPPYRWQGRCRPRNFELVQCPQGTSCESRSEANRPPPARSPREHLLRTAPLADVGKYPIVGCEFESGSIVAHPQRVAWCGVAPTSPGSALREFGLADSFCFALVLGHSGYAPHPPSVHSRIATASLTALPPDRHHRGFQGRLEPQEDQPRFVLPATHEALSHRSCRIEARPLPAPDMEIR